MKCKKLQTALLFCMLISSAIISQTNDFECATEDSEVESASAYSYSVDADYLSDFEPVVLNIFFWQIKTPTGGYSSDWSEQKLLESVAMLNIELNPFNIFIKYRGFDFFDSPGDLPVQNYEDGLCVTSPGFDPDGFAITGRCQLNQLWTFINNNEYYDQKALNVYVPYGTQGFGGVASTSFGYNKALVKINSLNSDTMLHEIGHLLTLRHTRSTSENATREPFLPDGSINLDYNAETAGDQVVDTNANKGFYDASCACYPNINFEDCTYTGDETDTTGAEYTIFPEDVINTMSNAYPCSELYLTTGQAIRIQEAILSTPRLQVTTTTIASLYEPYTGIYKPCCYTVDDKPPLLQPGFDYEFVACKDIIFPSDGRPDPWPYADLSFESGNIVYAINSYDADYSRIVHYNGTAINILQLEDQPRKCYSDLSKVALGGAVVKFNDGVLNSNITVSPKDSLGINNPNLILDLENGLYLIETQFDDGTQEQNVILKENNNQECP